MKTVMIWEYKPDTCKMEYTGPAHRFGIYEAEQLDGSTYTNYVAFVERQVDQYNTAMVYRVKRCSICNEELFEHEQGYCEDCRCSGDLEDVLDAALSSDAS